MTAIYSTENVQSQITEIGSTYNRVGVTCWLNY